MQCVMTAEGMHRIQVPLGVTTGKAGGYRSEAPIRVGRSSETAETCRTAAYRERSERAQRSEAKRPRGSVASGARRGATKRSEASVDETRLENEERVELTRGSSRRRREQARGKPCHMRTR